MGERYAGAPPSAVADYFCLAPRPIEHSFSVHANWSVGAGAGVGLGGRVQLEGVIEVKLGCYAEAEVSGGEVSFGYENAYNMAWNANYGHAAVEVGVECGAGISLDFLNWIFGSSDVGLEETCSGSAETAQALLLAAYEQLGDDWPQADVLIEQVCVEDPQPDLAGADAYSMGSQEGVAETGDLSDNSAGYRRADIVVRIQSLQVVRHTVPAGGS